MKKTLLTIFALLGLTGCIFSAKSYYLLSVVPNPTKVYHQKPKIIAVETITIPTYLYKREIAVANSSSEITLLNNALWGEDLDEGITNRVIVFLQKKFQNPEVYPYPWGIDKQPEIKIAVQISRFIAQDKRVYLDASWRIEKIKTDKSSAKIFQTIVATSSDTPSIVTAMNSALSELEEALAKDIKNFR